MSEQADDSAHSAVAAVIDLDTYPLHHPASPQYADLVAGCRGDLRRSGMFDLAGFLRPAAIVHTLGLLRPLIDQHSFEHRRTHNIYFLPPSGVHGVDPSHPSLAQLETVNRTVCADQLTGSALLVMYQWPGLTRFLAATMGVPELHTMADPLACVNVMSYRDGEALNWHFDRSEFTTTLLLQQPIDGGEFEFRPGLRTDDDPNHDAVARLMAGDDGHVQRRRCEPGTLTVFAGRNTAHRVTAVRGSIDRVIAVFSFFDRPGVVFSADERIGFYGRPG
jgi:hypothetical protein